MNLVSVELAPLYTGCVTTRRDATRRVRGGEEGTLQLAWPRGAEDVERRTDLITGRRTTGTSPLTAAMV